jgi:hypothetical protein
VSSNTLVVTMTTVKFNIFVFFIFFGMLAVAEDSKLRKPKKNGFILKEQELTTTFGVSELVPTSAPPFSINDPFRGRNYKPEEARKDDKWVKEQYDKLKQQKHPALNFPVQNNERWRPMVAKHCQRVVNMEHATPYGVVPGIWSKYFTYDIRTCPVVTPECLIALDSEAMPTKAGCLNLYRKCCIEHRRMRILYTKVATILESKKIPFYFIYGCVYAVLRDGGAMHHAETDIDIYVSNKYLEKTRTALRVLSGEHALVTTKSKDPNTHDNLFFNKKETFADTRLEIYHNKMPGFESSGPNGPVGTFYGVRAPIVRHWQQHLIYYYHLLSGSSPFDINSDSWKVPLSAPDTTGMFNLNWNHPSWKEVKLRKIQIVQTPVSWLSVWMYVGMGAFGMIFYFKCCRILDNDKNSDYHLCELSSQSVWIIMISLLALSSFISYYGIFMGNNNLMAFGGGILLFTFMWMVSRLLYQK